MNFPIGGVESRMPYEVIYAMCLIKKVCAEYYAEMGMLSGEVSAAICQAADER
jgi:fumarate hydratase class II